MATTKIDSFDRVSELKAFDETKTGVKGLVDAGITQLPRIFHDSPSNLANPKPLSSDLLHLTTIPTIDLGGRVSEDETKRKNTIVEIREAAEKWGFFQVVNHGVSLDLLERMKDGVRRFNEQSSEVKKQYYSRDFRKEFVYTSNFDLYTSSAASWRDTFSCYMAPNPPKPQDLPAICRDVMLEYSKEATSLGEFLFELISEALGLNPNHLKEIDCSKGLRMLCHYYPPCPEPDLTLGASKHSDSSFLTVLLPDQIEGLQVLREGYWFGVPPVPDALIINVGDLLQASSSSQSIHFAQNLPIGLI
ncbi:1-aminocyclopropane-1-carboxylate oxidase 2 [Hirschfeldia incana]|nr:1-aminocyclopropane-1-carboxylate oxidase 2 [Hirschfeldia incana]